MKSRRCLCLLVLICVLKCTSIRCEDAVLELADRQMSLGDYSSAITEYKRFLFFNVDAPNYCDVTFKTAKAYSQLDEWVNARHYFQLAIDSSTNENEQFSLRISESIVLIGSKKYSEAIFILNRVSSFCADQSIVDQANFYIGLCYLYQHQWGDAQKYLRRYFINNQTDKSDEISKMLASDYVPKHKSVSRAVILSTVLPGLGQLYIGRPKEAVNALAVNAATVYTVVNPLASHDYMEAISNFFIFFKRYYGGNRFHTKELAIMVNNEMDVDYEQKLIESLKTVVLSE